MYQVLVDLRLKNDMENIKKIILGVFIGVIIAFAVFIFVDTVVFENKITVVEKDNVMYLQVKDGIWFKAKTYTAELCDDRENPITKVEYSKNKHEFEWVFWNDDIFVIVDKTTNIVYLSNKKDKDTILTEQMLKQK